MKYSKPSFDCKMEIVSSATFNLKAHSYKNFVGGGLWQIEGSSSFRVRTRAQARGIKLSAHQDFLLTFSFPNIRAKLKMEVLLGITGKDFTIVAASKAAMRGATILKASDDKTRELNKHNLMAFSGEAGDTGT